MKVYLIPANGVAWMFMVDNTEWYLEIYSRLYFQAHGKKSKGITWRDENIHHTSQQ